MGQSVTPGLLELDERALPSAAMPVGPMPAPVAIAGAAASHPLHGGGGGSYLGPRVNVDAGESFTLTATVTLGSLGTFKVTGAVQGVGFMTSGRATGELTLTNAHGSITLDLHSRPLPGFSPVPNELVYSVAHGTGDFAHLSGYGVVGLARVPAPTAIGMPPAGTLTLSFY